jgi:hypothetical protein
VGFSGGASNEHKEKSFVGDRSCDRSYTGFNWFVLFDSGIFDANAKISKDGKTGATVHN